MNKANKRTCIATSLKKEKEFLIRISLLKNGNFQIGNTSGGRGAYISKDLSVIDDLFKKKLLHRCFRINVKDEVYDELVKKIKESITE